MRQIESFFWGIIAALGALFFELLVFIGYLTFSNIATEISFSSLFVIPQLIIIAALLEESLKYLVISKRIEMFSLEKSYIINSLFVGAGFFSVELGLIASSSNLPSLRILAELAIVHLGTAGIMGYLIALKNPRKISTFFSAVILTTTLHASYNFLILKRDLLENYIIIILLAFLIIINIKNFFLISKKLTQ